MTTKTNNVQYNKKNDENFKINGCWGNVSKAGAKYLVCPLTPEIVVNLVKELAKYTETGCRLMSFECSERTNEKSPVYTHVITPCRPKE